VVSVSADVQGLEFDFVRPGETGHVAVPPPRAGRIGATPKRRRRRPRRVLPRRWRTRRALPLAIGLVSAVAFWAATDGGAGARTPTSVVPHLDQLLERVGLGLSEIAVSGQQMVPDRAIYERLALSGTRSIWTIDTDAARRRLETVPWIEKASLKRIFPDRLLIEIKERQPVAIWRDANRAFAVGPEGGVLGEVDQTRFTRLPSVFGVKAASNAPSIIAIVRRVPELDARVALFERVAERRWTLHLKSGRRILLPADGEAHALLSLMKGPLGARLIDLDFEVLDLRVAASPAIEMRRGGRG
jgi:cell division protein FtsQ